MSDDASLLLEQAYEEPPNSHARVDLLLAAARAADAAQDDVLGFEAREEIVRHGLWAGRIPDMLTAFAWCLAECDRAPEKFEESQLHWQYKWVLEEVPRFAEVPRAKIEALLDDAIARFGRRGVGDNAIAKLRARTAMQLGDPTVAEHYQAWKRTRRDALSDCAACDLVSDVELLAWMSREADALVAAEAVINGRQRCAEVPHLAYGMGLPLLLGAGRRDDVVKWIQRGYPMLRQLGDKSVGQTGEYLLATAVIGDRGRGLRMLKETIADAAIHPLASARFDYLVGAVVLLERLAREGEPLTVALPAPWGGSGVAAPHDPRALAEDLAARARAIAAAFDARNGNGAQTAALEAKWRLGAVDLPGPVEPASGED